MAAIVVKDERGQLTSRPSLVLEQTYATMELGELLSSAVYYGAGVPRGDGHRVLLLPGFLGSDGYLTILASWLARIGYRPAQACIFFNVGSLPALLRHVERRVEQLADDGQRITIIGHSLGGMFARITAGRRPDLVMRAISLGSPLTHDARAASHPSVRALASILLHGDQNGLLDELNYPLPPDVRGASLYTRGDAVVDWRACLDRDPGAINVEVRGSHTGLTWNADVYNNLGRLLLS